LDGRILNSGGAMQCTVSEEWTTDVIGRLYKGKRKKIARRNRSCKEINLLNVAYNVYGEFITGNVYDINLSVLVGKLPRKGLQFVLYIFNEPSKAKCRTSIFQRSFYL
jgi:hypothetical protein